MPRFVLVLLFSCVTLAVALAFVDVWLEHVLHFRTPTADGTPLPFIPRVLGLFVVALLQQAVESSPTHELVPVHKLLK